MAKHEVVLAQVAGKSIAWADERGLWIDAGWTVGIPAKKACEYVDTIDQSPDQGFFRHEGRVVLSHGSAKIYLSEQEASAIIELIKAACGCGSVARAP